MGVGAILVIVFAEHLCVLREMREGLKSVTKDELDDHESRGLDDIDMDAISVDDEDAEVDDLERGQ